MSQNKNYLTLFVLDLCLQAPIKMVC
jgi:hypothetical protein